jgi:hypothetical protein
MPGEEGMNTVGQITIKINTSKWYVGDVVVPKENTLDKIPFMRGLIGIVSEILPCGNKVRVWFGALGASYVYTYSDMNEFWEKVSSESTAPAIQEKPCRLCARKNYTDCKVCWWCETSNPTETT